jgi:hypothetical protein
MVECTVLCCRQTTKERKGRVAELLLIVSAATERRLLPVLQRQNSSIAKKGDSLCSLLRNRSLLGLQTQLFNRGCAPQLAMSDATDCLSVR